jgi:hypothetical protein
MEKDTNIATNPGDLNKVSRIVTCLSGAKCSRTIVEYFGAVPETRHSRGLPAEVMELAAQLPGVEVVRIPCDHHGGRTYPSSIIAVDVI